MSDKEDSIDDTLDDSERVILRRWTATARQRDKKEYPRHFVDEVIPALQSIEGFPRGELVAREVGSLIEFTVLTWWQSVQAIRDFSGEDLTVAVVEPDAQKVLADYDRTVTLHERLATTSQPGHEEEPLHNKPKDSDT